MNKIINIYKPIGITPLQLISGLRNEYPEFKNVKIGYAGRLDPMAHGVMLLMIGDATKEREKYLGLDKEYEFEVLFGISTDTYDILGLILENKLSVKSQLLSEEKFRLYIKDLPKNMDQMYPPYSSKEVNGKPLYLWSRENRQTEITIPARAIKINNYAFLNINKFSKENLEKLIYERINKVKGDFRQEEIIKRWREIMKGVKLQTFLTAKFRINCSSGTYIRGLVNDMGQAFGTGAIALDILRTKVDTFTLDESLNLKSLHIPLIFFLNS